MGKLVRKDTGVPIIGTADLIPGIALVAGATRMSDGILELEWQGGTDVDWNGQKTILREGQRVFVDDDGEEVLEGNVELIDD